MSLGSACVDLARQQSGCRAEQPLADEAQCADLLPAMLVFPGCSYMSPELFLHDDVSPALDVYSFGIIREWPLRSRQLACSCNPAACMLGHAPLPPRDGCPRSRTCMPCF